MEEGRPEKRDILCDSTCIKYTELQANSQRQKADQRLPFDRGAGWGGRDKLQRSRRKHWGVMDVFLTVIVVL